MERWLAFLVTQRRLKPAAEGYQVCAGEEREDEHPHFSGHDLTLSQILRGARNELSLLNDAQWSPESLAFNHPASAPYIQELATICQQLAQRLQRPVRLLEVGTRTGRAAESLLAQLNAGQIEYVGLEQSQEMLLSARQRLAPWPGARLSLWNADTLAAHYLARPASTVSMAMRSRGYNASSYNVLTGRCAAIPVNFRPPSPGVCRGGWCRNGSSSSTPYR